jgi:hypothetical protein
MEFTGADLEQLAKIKLEIAKTLRPFRHNTEAFLAVAALIQCARVLIDRYPPERRAAIVEACALFLNHDSPDQTVIPFDVTGGRGGGPTILTP